MSGFTIFILLLSFCVAMKWASVDFVGWLSQLTRRGQLGYLWTPVMTTINIRRHMHWPQPGWRTPAVAGDWMIFPLTVDGNRDYLFTMIRRATVYYVFLYAWFCLRRALLLLVTLASPSLSKSLDLQTKCWKLVRFFQFCCLGAKDNC
jgi:hypothetical protein